MDQSKASKSGSGRREHKARANSPVHRELAATNSPRAQAAESAPLIYSLRLPPRARSYSKAELTAAAVAFAKLKRGEDLREQKVNDIRTALAHEDYENALKVEIAVQRLLDELAA